MPVAFGTAWYALVDLAGLRAGQRLLVHAATGGVGHGGGGDRPAPGRGGVRDRVARQARTLLAAMGLASDHIASSRDGGFEAEFLAVTGGAGMDMVLNALAGELTDASLRLLPRGGVFVEMGKTDLRDPAAGRGRSPGGGLPGVRAGQAGPDRLGEILAEVMGLLADGVLAVPPVRRWDVRRAREAFRFMSQARHTGKIVLTIPPTRRPPGAGTVLVTGGTGTAGRAGGRGTWPHRAGRGGWCWPAGRAGRGRARPGWPRTWRRRARGCGWWRATPPTGTRWPALLARVPAR